MQCNYYSEAVADLADVAPALQSPWRVSQMQPEVTSVSCQQLPVTFGGVLICGKNPLGFYHELWEKEVSAMAYLVLFSLPRGQFGIDQPAGFQVVALPLRANQGGRGHSSPYHCLAPRAREAQESLPCSKNQGSTGKVKNTLHAKGPRIGHSMVAFLIGPCV